jgi:hypothetical protein
MTPKTFTSVPLPPADNFAGSKRAVIEFGGLDQSGPSYEGVVYLNNPTAGPDTPRTPEQGYAGSFHVYSYGMARDPGTGHAQGAAILPMRRQIAATDAVKRAAEQAPIATVTLVPIAPGGSTAQPAAPPAQVVVDTVRIFTD